MRRLLEWQYKNAQTNGVSSSNQIPTGSTTLSYKEKFQKIYDYQVKQLPNLADDDADTRIELTTLFETALTARLYFKIIVTLPDKSITSNIKIIFGKKSRDWYFEQYVDFVSVFSKEGHGFNTLLDFLVDKQYIPPKTSALYQELQESLTSTIDEAINYENLWDEEISKTKSCQEDISRYAEVYLSAERAASDDENFLKAEIEKTNPGIHVRTNYNMRNFLSRCEGGIGHNYSKFYTDAKGLAEIKKACEKIPTEYKEAVNKTLDNIVVIDNN